ncbi:MAG: hypothetical protein ACOCX4_09370 [Planctomycetota bacterium]
MATRSHPVSRCFLLRRALLLAVLPGLAAGLVFPRMAVAADDFAAGRRFRGVLLGGLGGLLLAAPVAMAYVQRPEEALRAAAALAAWGRTDATEHRGAGRALAAVFLARLRDPERDRKSILAEARRVCGSGAVEEAILLVRSARGVDRASSHPADVVTLVLRAWYGSTSYADALARLGPGADAVRRGLVGALAGLEYGEAGIPADRWPDPHLIGRVDRLLSGLHELARDNILLPVTRSDLVLAATDRSATGSDRSAAADDDEEAAPPPATPPMPAMPSIPEMPPMPATASARASTASRTGSDRAGTAFGGGATHAGRAADTPIRPLRIAPIERLKPSDIRLIRRK